MSADEKNDPGEEIPLTADQGFKNGRNTGMYGRISDAGAQNSKILESESDGCASLSVRGRGSTELGRGRE